MSTNTQQIQDMQRNLLKCLKKTQPPNQEKQLVELLILAVPCCNVSDRHAATITMQRNTLLKISSVDVGAHAGTDLFPRHNICFAH